MKEWEDFLKGYGFGGVFDLVVVPRAPVLRDHLLVALLFLRHSCSYSIVLGTSLPTSPPFFCDCPAFPCRRPLSPLHLLPLSA